MCSWLNEAQYSGMQCMHLGANTTIFLTMKNILGDESAAMCQILIALHVPWPCSQICANVCCVANGETANIEERVFVHVQSIAQDPSNQYIPNKVYLWLVRQYKNMSAMTAQMMCPCLKFAVNNGSIGERSSREPPLEETIYSQIPKLHSCAISSTASAVTYKNNEDQEATVKTQYISSTRWEKKTK